tara:strand:- start:127 stop:798 length:672 start_codon:yes stop_codon:yes gene_type:complete
MDGEHKIVELEVEVVWSGRSTRRIRVAVPEDWDDEASARLAEEHAEDLDVRFDDDSPKSSFRVRPIGPARTTHADLALRKDGVVPYDPRPMFVDSLPSQDRWFTWRGRRWATNGIALVRDDAPRPMGLWVNGDPDSVWMGRHPDTLEEAVRPGPDRQPLRWVGSRLPSYSVLRGDDGSTILVNRHLSFLIRACDLESMGHERPIACRMGGRIVAYVMTCRDDS